MHETATLCEHADGAVAAIGKELARAAKAADSATAWLQERLRSTPNDALPGASPYLRMMGLVAGAHYLARGALVADDRLAKGDGDKTFLRTRIAVAQFFAEQILPQAEAQLGPITRGAGGAFALSADELSA